MISTRFTRTSLAIAAAAALTACGGGGSDVPQRAAPTAVAVKVTGMNIKVGDVLAQTRSTKTSVSFLGELLQRFTTKALFVGTAFANGQPTINPGANFGFTYKIEDGALVSLDIRLTDTNGNQITCNTSTAEAKIHQVWVINPSKGHLLAKADVPAVVNPDCTVTYKTAMLVITETGTAIEINIPNDSISRVIEAGAEGSNSSDLALLVFQTGAVRTLTVNTAGNAVLETLNDQNLPLKLDGTNSLAFDGTYLVAVPKDRRDAVLVFNAGTKSFRIISTTSAEPAQQVPSTGYYSTIMLTAEGTFVWHEYDQHSRELNPETGTYVKWAPAQHRSSTVVETGPVTNASLTSPMARYGFNGRSGGWIMSDRCLAWNYQTNQWASLHFPADPKGLNTSFGQFWNIAGQGGAYSKIEKGFAHCVGPQATKFTRLDLSSMTFSHFDTDALGYYFSSNRKFEIFKDKAMLWGAVSTANSDVKVLELNFETGLVRDHGTISAGDRQVIELVPVGG